MTLTTTDVTVMAAEEAEMVAEMVAEMEAEKVADKFTCKRISPLSQERAAEVGTTEVENQTRQARQVSGVREESHPPRSSA